MLRKYALSLAVLLTLLSSATFATPPPAEAQTPYHWTILPSMPTPRTEVTSAAIGSDVYVIGGFEEGRVTSDRVEIYNTVDRSWRSGPRLPVPLHHTVAVTLNDNIYVLGGYLEGWRPVDTVYIYDPGVGSWRDGPRMPRAKAAFTAQIVEGNIYTIGGATVRDVAGRLVQEVLDVNEHYDPEADTWTTANPLPTPREHLASAQIRGKIYVVGGRSLTLETNTGVNEEYDPQTDTWTRKAPMPTARGGIAAASFLGRVFVFGGESVSGTFDEVEMYNPLTDGWTQIDPMPTSRHGLTAVTVRDGILVVGGGVEAGYSYSGANEFLDPPNTAETERTSAASSASENRILVWFGVGVIVLMAASAALYLKGRRR